MILLSISIAMVVVICGVTLVKALIDDDDTSALIKTLVDDEEDDD